MFVELKYNDEAETQIKAVRKDGSVVILEKSSGPIGDMYQMALEGKFGDVAAYTPPPPPPLSVRESAARQARDRRLAASDWTQLQDAPLDKSVQAEWARYRSALRKVPQQDGFPDNIEWPEKPGSAT